MQCEFLNLLLDIYKDEDESAEEAPALLSTSEIQSPSRTLLHSDIVIDLVLPIVESMDSADAAPLIRTVRQRLRPPRHTTSPEPFVSSHADETMDRFRRASSESEDWLCLPSGLLLRPEEA